MEWSERLTGYRLEPPLSIAEVERFEEQNQVVLPADYRTFITTVCSGIYAEPDQPGYLTELLCPPKLDLDESLRRPFPLHEHRPFDDDEEFDEARQGQLYVATDGCTCDWYLIVTGAERGGMWEIEPEGAQPCHPKLTFLPWLELRIDCDSGRSSTEWWDAVWRDVQPVDAEKARTERFDTKERLLRDALRVELERHFPHGAYRSGDDTPTIAIFEAAHPDVGDAAVCIDGDEAIVFIGNFTREYFKSRTGLASGTEGAAVVARNVMGFLTDLFTGKIFLWPSTDSPSGGQHIRKSAFREEDAERWGQYLLWSGPIEKKARPNRGWRLW